MIKPAVPQFAIILGLLCLAPAFAQLPKKPPPQGMLAVPTDGTGCILTSHMGGTTSARKMLLALKTVSGDYFDQPLVVTRAFADRDDQNLQAAFTAKLKGIPVRGVAAVTMSSDSGQGTLLFDNAKTFTKSFRTLAAQQSKMAGSAGKAAPIQLTRQTAPDGSAQISLPPGFRITGAYKGTLDISGPHNAVMALGSPTLCTRPEAAAMYPGMPAVNFNDPVRAMLDYVGFMSRNAGVAAQVKVLDAKPVEDWPNGHAAYIRYTVKMGGKSVEGFGLFSIAPTDVNDALFYQSFLNAPTETYRTQFPAMLKAWGTYSINPSVFYERLMAAAQSMRGMSDIIQDVNANREQTYAKVNEAWDDYISDQSTWSNPTTGGRYKIPNATVGNGIPMQNGVALQPVPLSNL